MKETFPGASPFFAFAWFPDASSIFLLNNVFLEKWSTNIIALASKSRHSCRISHIFRWKKEARNIEHSKQMVPLDILLVAPCAKNPPTYGVYRG